MVERERQGGGREPRGWAAARAARALARPRRREGGAGAAGRVAGAGAGWGDAARRTGREGREAGEQAADAAGGGRRPAVDACSRAHRPECLPRTAPPTPLFPPASHRAAADVAEGLPRPPARLLVAARPLSCRHGRRVGNLAALSMAATSEEMGAGRDGQGVANSQLMRRRSLVERSAMLSGCVDAGPVRR